MDIRTPDGVLDCHLFYGGPGDPRPAVLMYMDAFGIRPDLASMADRLAGLGVVVALPNLYYRTGPFEPFDKSKVFTDGPEKTRFKGMIASIDAGMVMRDTAEVMRLLESRPGIRPGSMGAVGYCMGGGYALAAAGTFPERIAMAASFHGGSLATDKPDSPHLLAGRMRGRIYVGAAGTDPSFDDAQEARLRAAFDAAGVRHTVERYPGARHGFAVTGHPVYEHAAAELHWETLSRLLRDTLFGTQEEE
jgi:carboxymethylenebutenolidase